VTPGVGLTRHPLIERGGRADKRFMRRRIAKWAGLVACLLIGAAWLCSDRWSVTRRTDSPRGRTSITLWSGNVNVAFFGPTQGPRPLGLWGSARWSVTERGRLALLDPSWPRMQEFGNGRMKCQMLRLPLWVPAAVFAVPAAWLWWGDRRRKRPGSCAGCGYDLAGLPAVCPECGRGRGGGRVPGRAECGPRARIMPA
jgi:hypothetical protein